MKYVVIVNQKYLVSVEAKSHGGAEHKILDNVYYGVETCQAFTIEEMTTDTFKALAENCETISYSEMLKKGELYQELYYEMEHDRSILIELTEEIETLYKRIKELRNDSEDLTNNIITYKQKIKEIW